MLQEIAKDRRSFQIENRKAKANQNAEATPRQIAFLKRNNISFKEGITKKDASALIDKKFAEEKDV